MNQIFNFLIDVKIRTLHTKLGSITIYNEITYILYTYFYSTRDHANFIIDACVLLNLFGWLLRRSWDMDFCLQNSMISRGTRYRTTGQHAL